MFHWICPECGREIPPAVKECSTCDPQSAVAAAAETQVETATDPVAEALPQPTPAPPTAAKPPAEIVTTPPAPPVITDIPDPLLRLAQKLREAQRDLAAAAAAAIPEPEPAPPPVVEEATAPVEAEPASAEPALAESIPTPEFTAQPAQLLLAAAPSAVALLAPVEVSIPAVLAAEPVPVTPSIPDPAQAGRIHTPGPELTAAAPASKPFDLAILSDAPPTAPPPPAGQSNLKSTPAAPALTLAPLQDSSNLGTRIRPASPPLRFVASSETGHRVTLPGPALPRTLTSLEGAGISKILVERPKAAKAATRGWLAGLLVAAVLLAGLLGLELYTAPRTAANVKPAPTEVEAAPPAPVESQAPAGAASTATSYPLSKAVEVTGLRFVGDKKPEVHYLVVNHSPAGLSAVTVYVTIRSSIAKPGQPPLYHFSFRAPALGPFESKEMVASVDKLVHPTGDWQNLHADVELGQ